MSRSDGGVLKTLLVSDLVESTALVERLGDARAAELFRSHDRLARDLLEEHHGIEVDKSDGFLLLFERPLEAVSFALAYHRGLQQLSERLDVTMAARVGIHLGEVHLVRNSPSDVARGAKPLEVEGLAKPFTARLMSASLGRQTLLSRGAFDLARRSAVGQAALGGLTWLSHGAYTLKGVDEPVELCEVGAEGEAPLRPPVDTEKVKRVSSAASHSAPDTGRSVSAGEMVGSSLGGFRVLSRLGAGGMGVVYEARDEALQRTVALKVLPSDLTHDPERRGRFLREARSAAAVSHPSVATIYQVGTDADRVYIAMELIRGISLRQALTSGPVSVEQSIRIAIAVTRGVACAHEAGVIHRDIKPDNVMLSEHGRIKVLDFGLAKQVPLAPSEAAPGSGEQSAEGRVAGTPGYMSPEQARGLPVDHRTDIYSIGVLIYELIAGCRPFPGETPMDLIIAATRDAPLPLDVPDAPPSLRAIVDCCLAKDPDARYADAHALLAALESIEGVTPGADEPILLERLTGAAIGTRSGAGARASARSAQVSTRGSSKRHRVGGIVGGVLVGAAILGVGVFGWRRASTQDRGARALPLAEPNAVLACPHLEASGVDEPVGWLGAAAADLACRRATIYMGGRYERTLLPAQLLDAPSVVSERLVADAYDPPEARPRAVEAAKARAQGWLDGKVERGRPGFTVTLVLRDQSGAEHGRGSGSGKYLHQAVREAMSPLVASGAIPRATELDPSEAPWANTEDPETRVALFDLEVSSTLFLGIPDASECDRVAPVLSSVTHRAPLEAQCEEVRRGGPEGVAPFPIDRSSPSAFALTAPLAMRYDPTLDAKALAQEMLRLREQAQDPRARSELLIAYLGLNVSADWSSLRLLAFGLVQEDPRSFWTWQVACGASLRQKGGEIAARGFQTWIPEQPDAWNIGSFANPADPLETRIRYGRRAVVLSPDYPLFAINLSHNLLIAGRSEEVRTLAAHLASGGPSQRTGAEVLLVRVEQSESKLGAALARARRAIEDVALISRLESGDLALVVNALNLGVVLGDGHEVADGLAERFVLAEPPRLYAYQEYTSYTAGLICLYASKDVSARCVRRLLELDAAGFFKTGHTALVRDLLTGLERYHAGDRAAVLRLWRPLPATLRGAVVRAELLGRLGDHDQSERIDREAMAQQADEVNGVSLAHVRAAERAARRGDKDTARQLATKVIDAWGASDTDVPSVAQMKKLVARLP